MPDNARFEGLVEIVLAVESAGFDLVTTMDHFYQIGVAGREEEPMLEVYSTLAALAARTSRVRLGAMVSTTASTRPSTARRLGGPADRRTGDSHRR